MTEQGVRPDAGRPEFSPRTEVRLAVVMYGGVSLAVYIYGVAKELFELVRATAPERPYRAGEAPPSRAAEAAPTGTREVYRTLGQMLEDDASLPEPGAPVRRRFVVDIVSGTSAGGINGVALAKAIAVDGDLEPVGRVWLEEADIGRLVNDPRGATDVDAGGTPVSIPGVAYAPPPRSLLGSARMTAKLRDAIGAIGAGSDARGTRLAEQLDLHVTATDLQGLDLPIQLSDRTVQEPRHRLRFHLALDSASGRNDFAGELVGLAAYAARATSAFPFAFEPMTVEAMRAIVPELPSTDPRWKSLFPDYTRADPPFPERVMSDGGILDNKPFSYATESIATRRAEMPVDRKLLYVEPAPLAQRERREGWPDALDTALSALLELPRQEAIREDVLAVVRRNRQLQRAREIVALASADATAMGRALAPAPPVEADEWAALGLSEVLERSPPGYGTYHRLRVRGLVDHLAEVVASAAGLRAESDEAFAAHYLVRAWKESNFGPERGGSPAFPALAAEAGELPTENRFLLDFDLPYRLRRLRFVLQKLRELGDPETAAAALRACELPVDAVEEQVEAWSASVPYHWARLNGIAARLARVSDELAARTPENPIGPSLAALRLGPEGLRRLLDARDDEAMRAEAGSLLSAGERPRAVLAIAAAVREGYRTAAQEAREAVAGLLGPHTAARDPGSADPADVLRYCLRYHYDAFDPHDRMLFPILFGTPLGETDNVEVVRISPHDASACAAPIERIPPGRHALRGTAVGNFGGFFDREWRRHDLTWGRLDGSERLIRSLVSDPDCAGELIGRAHESILSELRDEVDGDPGRAKSAMDWFREDYAPAPEPERRGTDEVLRRLAIAAVLLLVPLLEVRGIRGGRGVRAAARLARPLVRRLLDPSVGRLGAVIGLLGLVGAGITVPALLVAAAVVGRLSVGEWTRGWWTVLCLGIGAMLPTLVLAIGIAWKRGKLFAAAYDALFRRPQPRP